MKTQIFTLKTERQGYYDITRTVREAVRESGIQSGIAVVFCPHTTGAITINENADPDVKHDLRSVLMRRSLTARRSGTPRGTRTRI